MGSSKEDLAIIVRAGTEQLASDLARGASMLRAFAKSAENTAPKNTAADAAAGSFKEAGKAAETAKGRFAGAASGLASFAGKAMIAGGALIAVEAGFAGLSSAIELVKSSIHMAADIEQTTIAFETFLGSVEKTTQVMGDLRKFAAETPFSNSEVTQGARQLLAYGVAADQLIPTLKLVGTLAAATSTPLGENVYRYGTTKVQGVAHQLDINQLTNAGIDVNPGIAKILKIEESGVRKATEDLKVDFNVYKNALQDLADNRYVGLLDKQSKSLKGGFEQLTDAWDMVKLKLGQTIVRESGLKEMLKDGERFAKTIDTAMDSPGFRNGIKFIADSAKGVAQLSYEFARAGATISGVFFDSIARGAPGLERLSGSMRDFAKSAAEFKFDDEKLVNAAFDFTEAMSIGFMRMTRRAEKFADTVQTKIIDPFTKIGVGIERVDGFLNAPVRGKMAAWNQMIAQQLGGPPQAAAPPVAPEAPVSADGKQIVAEWKKLNDNFLAAGRELEADKLDDPAKLEAYNAADRNMSAFLRQFAGDRAENMRLLDTGIAPGRIGNSPLLVADRPAVAAPPKSPDEIAEDAVRAELNKHRAKMLDDARAAKDDRLRRQLGDAAPQLGQMMLPGALGPFGALAPALPMFAKGADRVRDDNITPIRLTEMADKLNKEFSAIDLPEKLADLGKLRDLRLISPDVYDKGRGNAVRDAAERIGLGTESKLASGALVGSSEDARLLAQFRAGDTKQSVEDLLRQILQTLQRDKGADVVRTAIEAAIGGVVNITP